MEAIKELRSFNFCIPAKVLDVLPEVERKASISIKGYKRIYLLELVTLVTLHHRRDEEGSHLKMEFVRNIIPNAEKYVRFLIDEGIIKRSGKPIVGITSYQYNFTVQYYSRFKHFPVEDQWLINKIKKHHLRKHNTKLYPGQNYYIRRLKIDPQAMIYVETHKFKSDKAYNLAKAVILKIQQGESGLFYTVDTTAGRYHSNLTNLPSNLRQYIRINGKILSNIDIKCSQPYLSTILLSCPAKVARFARRAKFSMLLKSLERIDAMDVQIFILLVRTGKLYEFLRDKLNEHGLTWGRDRVKRQMLKIMYGIPGTWSISRYVFYDLFPNVYERFCLLKGDTSDIYYSYIQSKGLNKQQRFEQFRTLKKHSRGNKYTTYKRFPILLQKTEAYLILDVILNRIYTQYPGTIAVSIHDSIMTSILTDDIHKVHEIMVEELTKFVGIQPTLKIEQEYIQDNTYIQIENIQEEKQIYRNQYPVKIC